MNARLLPDDFDACVAQAVADFWGRAVVLGPPENKAAPEMPWSVART
jgi:hypothetical protein